jgi:hypothetical protein
MVSRGGFNMDELEKQARILGSKIKLKPLQQWFCDSCGGLIEKPEDGWIEWYTEGDAYIASGYRIVHHDQRCMYNEHVLFQQGKMVSDNHLDDYVGPNGLVYLTRMLELDNLKDKSELIEMIRRLHVPYYEEARQYWAQAEEDGFFDGSNEVWPYLPSTCLRLIGEYGKRN